MGTAPTVIQSTTPDSTRLGQRIDDTHNVIQNVVEDTRNTLTAKGTFLPRSSSITSKLSALFGWASESPVGSLVKRAGIPVLVGVKGASALDAIEHHDGHALARSGGSLIAAIGAGFATGAVGGFFLGGGIGAIPGGLGGAAIGALSYIGIMHFSDDLGGKAADALFGDRLQASQNARIGHELLALEKKTDGIEAKVQTHSLNIKDNLALAQHGAELRKLLGDQVYAGQDSKKGMNLQNLNIDLIKGELGSIAAFRDTHKNELARPVPLNELIDTHAPSDSFENRTPAPYILPPHYAANNVAVKKGRST